MINWLCDRVRDFSGENKRRDNLQRINEKKEQFEAEITELIEALNSVVNIFDENIKKNKNRQFFENIEYLKEFKEKFKEINKNKNVFYENLELINQYSESNDWTSEKIFKDTLKNGLLKQRRETLNLNKQLRKRRRTLEFEIESCNKKLEFFKSLSNEEVGASEIYENIIEVVTEIIKEKIMPELNLIEDINTYNSKKQSKNITSISATGTRYSSYQVFLRNINMLYKISEKICG